MKSSTKGALTCLFDVSRVVETSRAYDIFDVSSFKTFKPKVIFAQVKPETIYLLIEESIIKPFSTGEKILEIEKVLTKINIIPELGVGLFSTVIGIVALIYALIQKEFMGATLMSCVAIAGLTIIFGSIVLKRKIERI